jgi:uncharacterized protein (DUF1015 family)
MIWKRSSTAAPMSVTNAVYLQPVAAKPPCIRDEDTMPTIITPFAGLRYNPDRVGGLDSVMTPPYDVIGAAERQAYIEQSPFSMIHLILGAECEEDTPTHNRFTRAAALLKKWRHDGILLPESRPALYLYQQTFTIDGQAITRTGFISRVRLADYQEGVIFPHEQTFAGPKADLLRLWLACRANLSQVFAVYQDVSQTLAGIFRSVAQAPPQVIVPHWGEGEHRLWVITDPAVIEQVQQSMRVHPLVIADGHHRYETALALRDAIRQQHGAQDITTPHEHIMMYCANIHDPGVLALPTHRLLHDMPITDLGALLRRIPWAQTEVYPCEQYGNDLVQLQRHLEEVLRQRRDNGSIFCFYVGGHSCYIVTVSNAVASRQVQAPTASEAWKQLDVSVLHHGLLPALQALQPQPDRQPSITYARADDSALQRAADGACDLVILMNPTPLEAMAAVAKGGERMPPKSTYFYPKLPTGLVINGFDV